MRNTLIVKNILILIFVGLLSVSLVSCGDGAKDSGDAETGNDSSVVSTRSVNNNSNEGLKIVYISIDSLNVNYDWVVDIRNELASRKTSETKKSMAREQNYYKEMQKAQQLAEGRTRSENEMEGQRLMKLEQEVMVANQKAAEELIQWEQAKMTAVTNELQNYLEELNADGKYDYILNNGSLGGILNANPAFDITEQVVDSLNARYARKKNPVPELK